MLNLLMIKMQWENILEKCLRYFSVVGDAIYGKG